MVAEAARGRIGGEGGAMVMPAPDARGVTDGVGAVAAAGRAGAAATGAAAKGAAATGATGTAATGAAAPGAATSGATATGATGTGSATLAGAGGGAAAGAAGGAAAGAGDGTGAGAGADTASTIDGAAAGGLAATGVRAAGAAETAGGVTAGRGAAATGGAMLGRGAGVITRFFSTSTCTTLLRPWLKLWRTLPASTVLPSSNRPPGRRLRRLLAASCSFWSLIPWSLSNSSCSYGRGENRSRHSVTIQVQP